MPMDNMPFDSKEDLLTHLENDMGLDNDKAERVAEVIMEEAKSEEGNPKELLQSIKNGAKNILNDIGLETVSWVETPSQDSMFVMMKDSENRLAKSTKVYKAPEDDWETVYGPVMRPNDIDKDGDVAPASDIRKAAHEFIAEGRVKQFDTNHDLNTGKGTLVESWILKEDKEYETPSGEKEVIEEGSWMVGVQPNKEIKEKIEAGKITGWSIFGQADQIALGQEAKFKTETETNAYKEDNTMPENQNDGGKQEGEGDLSIKDVHSEITELKSQFKEYTESPEPTTVKSVDELENTLKNLENDSAVIELSKDVELTTKEPEMDDMSNLMDYLEDQLNESNFSMLMDAVKGDEVEEGYEETEQGDDMEEDEEKTEKSANYKASDGESVREKQVNKSGSSGKLRPFKNQVEG